MVSRLVKITSWLEKWKCENWHFTHLKFLARSCGMKHKVTCLSVFNPCTHFLNTAVVQSRHQCLLHVILSCWEMDSSHILCTGACHVMTLCSFHEMSGDVWELLRNSDRWRYVSTAVTTANPLDFPYMQIKWEGHISAHTDLPAPELIHVHYV